MSSLVNSLLTHATVVRKDFPPCKNTTCSVDEVCKLIPHANCGHPSCSTLTMPTCIQNLTKMSPPSASNVTPSGLTVTTSSHAPSIESKRLIKRAFAEPQLVEVDASPPVYHPKRIGDGLLTSQELVAVALLTGDVDKNSRVHKGDGFALNLHPKSKCTKLPDHFDLGLVLLDPIGLQVNAAVGRFLNTGSNSLDGAVYTTYYDGITDVYLYSVTTKKMSNFAARKYCRQLGLGLPTLTSPMDLARIAPFTAIAADFWVDGNDDSTEGTWRSFYDKKLLNRLPWANGIEGKSRWQDCAKLR